MIVRSLGVDPRTPDLTRQPLHHKPDISGLEAWALSPASLTSHPRPRG